MSEFGPHNETTDKSIPDVVRSNFNPLLKFLTTTTA